MSNFFNLKSAIWVTTALALPHFAAAQIYDRAAFAQNNDLNIQAAVTFKIPLGSTDRRRTSDQPRLGFGLNLARNDFDSPLGRLGSERMTLLDVGAYGFKTPSVQLSGQEIYGPTFIALHADETEGETDKDSKARNSDMLLIVGGVTVVSLGALVLINEAADEFNDCFLVFTDVPDKCRD